MSAQNSDLPVRPDESFVKVFARHEPGLRSFVRPLVSNTEPISGCPFQRLRALRFAGRPQNLRLLETLSPAFEKADPYLAQRVTSRDLLCYRTRLVGGDLYSAMLAILFDRHHYEVPHESKPGSPA